MHYEIDVPLKQLIMPLKLKHKIDRYVGSVNVVNVVFFTKNWTVIKAWLMDCARNVMRN